VVDLLQSLLNGVGWPLRHVLLGLHAVGITWPWVIVLTCICLRLAMVPIAYARTRATRTMSIISVRRGVELHRAHVHDPEAYQRAFAPLYVNNRVRPLTTGVWYLAQIALFILVASALGSLYGRFGSVHWFGANLASRGLDSPLGITLAATEGSLLALLLWRARNAWTQAAWYLRVGAAFVLVASTVMLGLLIALPILIYLVVAMLFSFIDDWAVLSLVRWRHGPRGWPVYDETGAVIAYGLDSPAL
jgi:membrane protein insertase Oxa1/YidC/SpoIIIJ